MPKFKYMGTTLTNQNYILEEIKNNLTTLFIYQLLCTAFTVSLLTHTRARKY